MMSEADVPDAAVDWAWVEADPGSITVAEARRVIEAAMDPALGDDQLIHKGTVLAMLRGMRTRPAESAADALAHVFGGKKGTR